MTREDKLFKRIRAGGQQALDKIIEMYYPEILTFCVWHTIGKENAEDTRRSQMTIVLVTHDIEIAGMCDRQIEIADGRVIG